MSTLILAFALLSQTDPPGTGENKVPVTEQVAGSATGSHQKMVVELKAENVRLRQRVDYLNAYPEEAAKHVHQLEDMMAARGIITVNRATRNTYWQQPQANVIPTGLEQSGSVADVPPMIRLPGRHWKSPAGMTTKEYLIRKGVASCALRGMTEEEMRIALDNLTNHGNPNVNAKYNAGNLPPESGGRENTGQTQPAYRASARSQPVIYQQPTYYQSPANYGGWGGGGGFTGYNTGVRWGANRCRSCRGGT